MIIFGYNLDFVDEPLEDELNANEELERVEILEKSNFLLQELFEVKSNWSNMTQRDTRYLSRKSFSKQDIDSSWALEVKNIVTLIWCAKSKSIYYVKGNEYSKKLLHFWVIHTFFPLVLELRNIYHILHVGAVEVEKRVILFSALSFGGKSTLTDFFLTKGHKLLSDDTLGVLKDNITYSAVGSYPYHRPYREAEELGYFIKNFSFGNRDISGIYVLQKGNALIEVSIDELFGIEKFKALYYTSFVNFDFMKQKRFEFFSDMLKSVRLYKVNIPWDKNRLNEVYDAIVSHSLR